MTGPADELDLGEGPDSNEESGFDSSFFEAKMDTPMTLPALQDAFNRALPEQPDDAVDAAFEFIEGNFAQGDLEAVDEALAHFTACPVGSHRVEAAMLRASSRVRSALPHWAGFLAAARAAMERDGEDWKRALRGLA